MRTMNASVQRCTIVRKRPLYTIIVEEVQYVQEGMAAVVRTSSKSSRTCVQSLGHGHNTWQIDSSGVL